MDPNTPTPLVELTLTSNRQSSTRHLARLFDYQHLPDHLQAVSKPFHDLALEIVGQVEDGPELSTGLRRLVEAKDCVVRAVVLAAQDVAL